MSGSVPTAIPGGRPGSRFSRLPAGLLSNGLKLVLAERHSLPLVRFSLQLDAGYAADQFAVPGTAKLTMQMLDEGTARRNALQISDELASLGANLGAGSELDSSYVNLSSLTSTVDRALDIYADTILNPAFPETDFLRLQKQLLAGIQQEKNEPFWTALRVFPKLLYGTDHAYGNPLTGSGTATSVSKLTPLTCASFTTLGSVRTMPHSSSWAMPRWQTHAQAGETLRRVETRRDPGEESRCG